MSDPCQCGPSYEVDHSEFGLPLGYDRRCEKCGRMWNAMSHKPINPIDTYTISKDGKSITCLRCKRVSYHPADVDQRFCSNCGIWHDDIYPPARQHWIDGK